MAKFFRINDRIQAQTLRVIGPDGSQLGVISRDEALKKAQELELDLVEVAPQINPPVARIVDYEKFRYHEEKREQAARKHAKEVEIKEVWLSPRIAEHDLQVRLRKADGFLTEGNKVKLTVKFKGREMAHPENGHAVVREALSFFGDRIQVERETKFEGRNLTTIIGLAKAKPKEEQQDEKKDENENQEVTA